MTRPVAFDLDAFERSCAGRPERKVLGMLLLLAVRDGARELRAEPHNPTATYTLASGEEVELVPPPPNLGPARAFRGLARPGLRARVARALRGLARRVEGDSADREWPLDLRLGGDRLACSVRIDPDAPERFLCRLPAPDGPAVAAADRKLRELRDAAEARGGTLLGLS